MPADETPLELEISEIIGREGPLTFRDFMALALYHPAMGYYNTVRVKIGPSGDYYTSSNVHRVFGAVLMSAFVDLWSKESPGDSMTILEAGAGTGQLALDILNSARAEHHGLFAGLRYLIVEKSPVLRSAQRSLLDQFLDWIEWLPDDYFSAPRAPASFNGIIFSNELIDAMPVHLVRKSGERFQEAYVTVGKSASTAGSRKFELLWGTLSSKHVQDYVAVIDFDLLDRQVIEVNLDAIEWLSSAASSIEKGFVVTVDYGDLDGQLYGRDRRSGTLRSFFRHHLAASPLDRVGEQDITSSVNFSALIRGGKSFGLETVSFERQSSFLIRYGILDRIADSGSPRAFDPRSVNERLAVKNLLVEGGSSDNFRVLVQRKTS